MNPRDRLRAVLAGEKPDRPVCDLGGRVASLNTSAYLDLKDWLGFDRALENETVTFLNTIGEIDERVLERFEIPLRRLYLNSPSTFERNIQGDGSFRDEWGVLYQPVGEYNERTGHPLAGGTLDDLESFSWPDPIDPARTAGLKQQAGEIYEQGCWALAAGHVSAGVFQDCWNLRGMEQFLLDLAFDRDFAEALLDKVLEVHIGLWHVFLEVVGDFVDIVETADDLAGQHNLLISPSMFREMVKPRQAALNSAIREKTDAKILYHSCGAILPLVDDLIETGVQILNPIQPLPGLMDPEELVSRYGDELIFHGGLDVQNLLPSGSPLQVQNHVRHYFEVFGSERYIMAPANSVQPGTPPENLVTAFDTAAAYRAGGGIHPVPPTGAAKVSRLI